MKKVMMTMFFATLVPFIGENLTTDDSIWLLMFL